MQLLVLGATGRTGRQVVTQVIERGHAVRALTRSPQKLADVQGVEVCEGSVADPKDVAGSVVGSDAVLVTLGNRSPRDAFGTTLMTDTMRALVPAMEEAGVERLVVLSAVGVGESARGAPPPIRLGFRTLFRAIAKDKSASEAMIRASSLDWVIVYPPVLTNDSRSGMYWTGEQARLRGMPRISRADVAHFMVAQADEPTYHRSNVVIAPAGPGA